MLSLRSLAATALRSLSGSRADDPDAEDDLPTEEMDALRRDLEGELARVAAPPRATSR